MFCIKCGKEVAEGNKFCTNCGAPMEEKEKEVNNDTLSYSQNPTMQTTSNPTPTVTNTNANSGTGDGKATASIVLGIVSIVFAFGIGFITSIIGLILGICSKKSGKKTAGIILNAIALALSIIVPIIVINMFGSLLFWTVPTTTTTTYTPSTTIPSTNNNSTATIKEGAKFKFDVYEMALGQNYEIVKDEKTSSSHYGENIIKLPVSIKNTSDSTSHLNMYYYDYYAPNGEEIESVRFDFGSAADAIDFVSLEPGETKIQYFYIIYKGNGKYKIKFDNYKEQKTVEFNIKK